MKKLIFRKNPTIKNDFSKVDIARIMMESLVARFRRKSHKFVRAVVVFFPDVMHRFTRKQITPKVFLNNKAMLEYIPRFHFIRVIACELLNIPRRMFSHSPIPPIMIFSENLFFGFANFFSYFFRAWDSFVPSNLSFWHNYLQIKKALFGELSKIRLNIFHLLSALSLHKKTASSITKISIVVILSLSNISCAMTAVKQGDVVELRGFGSGKAEFPDGTKIEKGLITFPELRIDN